jgi:hypothetical protein
MTTEISMWNTPCISCMSHHILHDFSINQRETVIFLFQVLMGVASPCCAYNKDHIMDPRSIADD